MYRRKTSAVTAEFVLILLISTFAFAQVGDNSGVLNPNLAGEEELIGLPHSSEELAQSIIENRPFLNMTGLNALLVKS